MRAPQYGQYGRRRRAKQGVVPRSAARQPVLVIPVPPGVANTDTIRQRPAGFMRLNTGFWRSTGTGLRTSQSPVRATPIERYTGACRAKGRAIRGQLAHGAYVAPQVKVRMFLWHKSARRKGVLVPDLQGNLITKV